MGIIMKDVRNKLANARELCPGMSNDMYLLTDYMSVNTNDELVPMGMLLLTVGVRDDLHHSRNGFGREFPAEVMARKEFLLNEIRWIPQVIDAIADEDFAEEFRQHWKFTFKSVPPKRVNVKEAKMVNHYPAYVDAAVEWWANAIISPSFDNGEAVPPFLSFLMAASTKEYTPDEIKLFKETLAQSVNEEVENSGRCSLDVDYHPCGILSNAGEKIGVNDMFGYPCKTHMTVTKTSVLVSAGYAAPTEEIWRL